MLKKESKLKDVLFFETRKFEDNRGFFTEKLKQGWLSNNWIQENASLSKNVGTLRGLHLQKGDFSQAKLVTVSRGKILDVIVDMRKSSPTYLQWEGYVLSDLGMETLYVPRGFAHGFVTLEANTIVNYKVDNVYNKDSEMTVKYNDNFLNINWGFKESELTISDKDREGFEVKEYSYE